MSEYAAKWTFKDGTANSSDKYIELAKCVERLIRNDAHTLLNGRADRTAKLIISQLAFVHGLVPLNE